MFLTYIDILRKYYLNSQSLRSFILYLKAKIVLNG